MSDGGRTRLLMSKAKTYYVAFALLVACAVIAFALWHLADLTGMEAVLTLACLLLAAAQIQSRVNRDTRADRTRAQVEDLALASAQAIRDMDGLKQSVAELKAAVKAKQENRDPELTSQLQVLETLVKQLAEQVASGRMVVKPSAPPRETAGEEKPSGREEAVDRGDGLMSDAEMIDTVRRSLEENRVDLYLQPIVTLPQRRTRFYEALTRLRDSSGEVIMPASYIRAAETAGIMPMIDNLLLFRCVKVVRRLVERNRDIGVFCNISPHSLLDSEFFPQFLEFMKQSEELSGSLIFELTQQTVNGAGPLELESMAMLHELGFQFSMDHVTTLDIDHLSLADRGFRYLKLDARVMIDGMGAAGSQIHAADLRALLARYGIDLIVEKIETERDVVTLLDYDVDLGQGYLFSEPRLVREEIIEARAQRASSVA